MRIKVLRQINSRWHDGRVLSAMDGTERTVDDADTDMIAHARHLAVLGDVEILDDVQEEAESGQDDGSAPAKTGKAPGRPRKAPAGQEAAE